ncbi:hypothetical protein HYALB_00000434 [Hymenoscyphus albidus]|uniref:Uncharacterized protein n=1 Tax=Hymenoscyphus albidus TaxID=595503 RepID=A0A9N9Q0D0_9HELO|nr:hypothetical protein HYALB_00000434 [Hymenoscyphus albidus]
MSTIKASSEIYDISSIILDTSDNPSWEGSMRGRTALSTLHARDGVGIRTRFQEVTERLVEGLEVWSTSFHSSIDISPVVPPHLHLLVSLHPLAYWPYTNSHTSGSKPYLWRN